MKHTGISPATAPATPIGLTTAELFVRTLCVGVLVVELMTIAAAVGQHDWVLLASLHIGLVASVLVAAMVCDARGLDSSELQKFAFLTFVGGPIGSAAALLSDGRLHPVNIEELQRWYETIAPPERAAVTLVDQIIDGRLVSERSQLPKRFDALLISGSMAEKQAALAYLALDNGRHEIAPALKLALRSTDQRVRVQAAAVAAHIRDRARKPSSLSERLAKAQLLSTDLTPRPSSVPRPDISRLN